MSPVRILHNATIHTLDPQQPKARAIALDYGRGHPGRVLALGELDELRAEFPRAELEDLRAATLLPGLTDAHIHLQHYAFALQMVDCDTSTRDACLAAVAAKAAQAKAGEWIRGHGWRQNNWPQGFGNAAMLDQAAPDNPVYLSAASLHAGWANSAALQAAGIDDSTPDPPNGKIQRDEHGQATGILFEEAMGLVEDAIPRATQNQITEAIATAQSELWRLGLTGVHNFDRRASFLALQSLRAEGRLGLRTVSHIPVERLEHVIEAGLRSGFGDDVLRVGMVKVFADGALGPRTAAMLEPYAGEPDNRGMLFVDNEELFEIAQRAADGGLGMTVHAIGDRANHEVLKAFEQLRDYEAAQGLPALRHRIEHVQVLHPDDMGRLGQLGIIASMQAIHQPADMVAADTYWGERAAYSYAWKAQLAAGAVLALGSDAPVETPNPFRGLHAAVTRRRLDGSPGPDGWHPEQRLTLDEALRGYTQGPAYAAGMETRLGRLAPGYLADLIVLAQDPYEIIADELAGLKPNATMVGGDWVWRAGD